MRFTINGNLFDIQTAKALCLLNTSISMNRNTSWDSCQTLNGIVLESMCSAEGISCISISDKEECQKLLMDTLRTIPPIVCISTSFICSKSVLEKLVVKIREISPQSIIIVGGPLVSLSYAIYKEPNGHAEKYPEIASTYIFIGENIYADIYVPSPSYRGERKLIQIAKRILTGQPVSDIEGIITCKDNKLADNIGEFTAEYEKPPTVNWNTLPIRYFSSKVIPLQTSVGCPYSCNFCNFPKNSRSTAIKTDKEIFDEIAQVYNRGARFIWFVDDNFRLGKRDLRTFSGKLAENNPGVQWMSLFRADSLSGVDPHLLKKAGCREVCLGLESADNEILRNMNKKESVQLYSEVVTGLLDSGINCSVYFIIGFPGETSKTVDKTIEFLTAMEHSQTHASLFWSIFPYLLVPQSPAFSTSFRQHHTLDGALGHWKHFSMDSKKAYEETLRIFDSLSDSGPIYRSDDLELTDSLNFSMRRKFYALRQQYAQKKFRGQNINQQDLIKSFFPLLL
jgi:anaerobic magnesium-protoporphyrin IX monomethyl ester cyclase